MFLCCSVCNVQKEIGVQMAYSLMTNNLKEENEKMSLGMSLPRCCPRLSPRAVLTNLAVCLR